MTTQKEMKWRPTNAPLASSRTDDIWFLDEYTGWAVNSNGQILKTTDGGDSWIEQYKSDGLYLRCIAFATPLIGWVGTLTPSKRMLHTKDGGTTWTEVENLPENPSRICGLFIVNETVIYASGTNDPEYDTGIAKSLDGGATWEAIDLTAHATLLIDCFFTSATEGWVVGGKGAGDNPKRDEVKPVVLYTNDGGATWVNQVENIQDQFPFGEWGWKIQFLNENLGYISLENFTEGAILKTTDGGLNWRRIEINDPQHNANLEGIGFIDEDHGWVGGWGNAAFTGGFSSETADGGATWQDANQIGLFINRFRFLGNPVKVGYASGKTVYKYSSDPIVSAIAKKVATEFLDTNEPVEFGGAAELNITVPENSKKLNINIWDRFGHQICQLVDETAPKNGTRKIVWDGKPDTGNKVVTDDFICRITIDNKSESRIIKLKQQKWK
jgi:photosystem II stability/assembly factor-like uncharacterized protein